ncbi:hypothetical protein SGLAM104S_05759 [Streptomyces glaucescens]
MRTFVRILLALLVAAGGLTLASANTALADAPVDLSREGQITDRVGALGSREPEVAQALAQLADDHALQLFVVYVRDFSGRSPQQWASETATRNGLGSNDALLAVATGDRQYSYFVDARSPLTRQSLSEVDATAVAPALRQNDWAGAALGAAQGYAAVLSGEPVPTVDVTPGEAEPGQGEQVGVGGGSWLFLLVVLVPLALVAYALRRRSRSRRAAGSRGGEETWGGPSPESLADLDAQARQALVRTDDAVRTSQEELGFAAAQFGDEATQPFTAAVEAAKRELTAAFRLRQQLDDAYPEDDATRLQMVQEILVRCAEANRLLDEKAEDFDRLRAFERNAPQALAAAQAAFDTASGRVVGAQTTLAAMRERYASSAIAPVPGDVEQAGSRLQFAQNSLQQARQAVEGNDNGAAAIQVRAAEAAVAQANRLIEAVDRRAQELENAAGALSSALTETDADLAEARGLLQGAKELPTAALQGRIARAETVVTEVRKAMETGRYDPIEALRRVEEADAGLDEALIGTQESEQGTRRARALLERTVLSAQSSIGAAMDYIVTNRGAVGSEARTRLAEAQRRLQRAEVFSGRGVGVDAHGALAEAQQADALAQDALLLAQDDVEGFGAIEPGVYAVGSAWQRTGRSDARRDPARRRVRRWLQHRAGQFRRRRNTRPDGRRPFLTTHSLPANRAKGEVMAKQTILGRVAQLARANINALIDQAEDPQLMLDQLIRDYTNNIREAEQAVATTIGNLRLMEQDYREDKEAATEWGRKALAASKKADELRAAGDSVDADRFDALAKVALSRQLQSEREAAAAEPTITSSTAVVDKLKTGLDQMQLKLQELHGKRDQLVARAKSAEAQNRMLDAVKSIDVLDPTSELSRFEETVRREEARAMGKEELAASSLDAQFEQLEGLGDATEIETRLAALKAA